MQLSRGFLRKYGAFRALVLGFTVFFGFLSPSHGQEPTRKRVYKKPSVQLGTPVAQTIKGRRIKQAQINSQSIYEGAPTSFNSVTTSKAPLVKPKTVNVASPWSTTLSTGLGKSMAAYTDWSGSVNAGVGYRTSRLAYSAGLGYSYQLDSHLTNDERKIYGVSDLTLGVAGNNLLKSDTSMLTPHLSWTIPTSEVSQDASLQSSVTLGLSFAQKTSIIDWSTSHNIIGSLYQYETANQNGTAYNSPIAVFNGLNLAKTVKWFTVGVGYGIYTSYNYANNTNNVQVASASTGIIFSKNISASLSYSWRDEILSNYKPFADDTSRLGFGLTYTM